MIAAAIPLTILPGFGRRIAGGVLNQWFKWNIGDTPARVIFGITVAVEAFAAGWVWWYAAVLILLVWAGSTAPLFGGLAQGRTGDPYWKDFLGLSAHGLLQVVLPCLWFWFVAIGLLQHHWAVEVWHWLPLLVAGLLISPIYTLGWSLTHEYGPPLGRVVPWLRWANGFMGGSEVGEFLWGIALGVGTLLSVVL